MNEFIELVKVLDDAGYEIAEFYDESYQKEKSPNGTVYAYRGINLRIIRVKNPKATKPPPEAT